MSWAGRVGLAFRTFRPSVTITATIEHARIFPRRLYLHNVQSRWRAPSAARACCCERLVRSSSSFRFASCRTSALEFAIRAPFLNQWRHLGVHFLREGVLSSPQLSCRRVDMSCANALPFGAPILFTLPPAFEFFRASTHGPTTLRANQIEDR